jgi:hypothetical protein
MENKMIAPLELSEIGLFRFHIPHRTKFVECHHMNYLKNIGNNLMLHLDMLGLGLVFVLV